MRSSWSGSSCAQTGNRVQQPRRIQWSALLVTHILHLKTTYIVVTSDGFFQILLCPQFFARTDVQTMKNNWFCFDNNGLKLPRRSNAYPRDCVNFFGTL